MSAIAPPPYPAANPTDDSVSAARPRASFGSKLAVKIEAMSNDTVATMIAAMIPSCDVDGRRARAMHAAAPRMELVTTARWCTWRRSTHADRNGDTIAEQSMVAARVHAHKTPPGRPHRPSAKAIWLK